MRLTISIVLLHYQDIITIALAVHSFVITSVNFSYSLCYSVIVRKTEHGD